MLVLSRRVNEEVVITVAGQTITIRVVNIQANSKVRLGVEADQSVRIDRREVYEARVRPGESSIPPG